MRISDWSSDVCSSDLNTVAAWHQEGRDTCLLLSRKIGRAVDLKLSRPHAADQVLRLKDDAAMLAEQHQLSFELNVPDAASEITVVATLQRRSLEASMSLAAPEDRKGTKATVNWLQRQDRKSTRLNSSH